MNFRTKRQPQYYTVATTFGERLKGWLVLALFVVSLGLYTFNVAWTFTNTHPGHVALGMTGIVLPPIGVINGAIQTAAFVF